MGTSRCGAFSLVAGLLLAAAAAPPGRCADPASDPVLSLQADACFVGRAFGGVTPIVVTIVNRGLATHASLNAHNRYVYESSSQYRSQIDLAGNGAKTRVILYPISRQNEAWGPQQGYTVDLDVPGHSLFAQVTIPDVPHAGQQIALLGDNFGTITPNRSVVAKAGDTHDQDVSYVRPENAPTRAIGYAGLQSVALGNGVQRLSPAQWSALRQWVISGGSLILVAKDYLHLPQVDALLPISPGAPETATKTNLPRLTDDLDLWKFAGMPSPVVGGVLRPGAQSIDLYKSGDAPVFAARRQLGAGTVLYFGVDPTQPLIRESPELSKLWQTLIAKAAPISPSSQSTQAAIVGATLNGWGTTSEAERKSAQFGLPSSQKEGTDPFEVALPSLPSVVYVFVAYFLLTVPVSFVVLKRMRRMNLAWVTGPTLAVLFGGVLYLFTSRLNTAPLARRTAGVLTAAAGDKTASFSGDTELFFPRSGAYNVTVPNADSSESFPVVSPNAYEGPTDQSDYDTIDDGSAIKVPRIDVANLSFQRLYHTQSVYWGDGIDSDISVVSSESQPVKIVGVIRNSTGRTLHNVYLALPHGFRDAYTAAVLLKLSDIAPGSNALAGHYEIFTDEDPPGFPAAYAAAYQQSSDKTGPAGWRNAMAPTLFASTSAADLGPTLGKYVGGDSTAQVIVSLPGLKIGGQK